MSNQKHFIVPGRKYGRLTAIKNTGRKKWNCWLWLCRCECGNEIELVPSRLYNNHTKSCGCLVRKHGDEGTRFYNKWGSIINRCKPTAPPGVRARYYDRGIQVCDRWLDYRNFKEDMYESWLEHEKLNSSTSIDRIDNNKGYSPGNCRWVTTSENMRNTSKTVMLTAFGKEKPLIQWAEEAGLNAGTVKGRIKRGWNPECSLRISTKKGSSHRWYCDKCKSIRI